MLDDVELRELRIFLAVLLVAAMRETGRDGPVQEYERAALAGLTVGGLVMPGAVSSADVRTAVRQFRNARPERTAGSHGPGHVVVSVAVPAESPARDIAATVNEYGAAGATHVAVLAAEDDADIARFAGVLGRGVSPVVAR